MPALRLIVASGTGQRRLLEETVASLEKKGYVLSGRQEGGEWNSLLSDNISGGLFDENRLVVVDSAALMGAMPENLSDLVDSESPVIILLVYETEPAKLIPKAVQKKCVVLKPEEFPRWPRERQAWVAALAKKMEVNIDRGGVALIVELLDDPEEIRGQLQSLSMLKKGGALTADDVDSMCMDDGSRNLLRLLDGLCTRDVSSVMKSFRAIAKNGDLIPLVSAMHNRMRLAWYAALNPRCGAMYANALGARDYAWRMACGAAKLYGAEAVSLFVTGLIKLNIDEKSGTSAGWNGLETMLISLMGREK